MSYTFTLDDVAYLTGATGGQALRLAADLPLSDRTLLADLERLRAEIGGRAAAVVETVLLRRRAAHHWGATGAALGPVGTWLLTDVALQQASPPPAALHRAARLARGSAELGRTGVHDVTCSLGTDLVALARAGATVIGSDLDDVRLAMARHNLAASGRTAALVRADATTAVTRGTIRYADPARRDRDGRRTRGTDTVPPVAAVLAADPGGLTVLRLPPALDYRRLPDGGESEIVSWRGTARELVHWPAPLAAVRRRATVLADEGIVEQLTSDAPSTDDVTAARRYVIDPDPAVVRAHLVGHYAARHQLTLLDPHLAYLTGDSPPPHVRAFEVLDAAPYAERTVRSWLRRDAIGTLEIKQRGTPVVPDALRARLRPTGDRRHAATLILARIGRGVHAYWCRAHPAPSAQQAATAGR